MSQGDLMMKVIRNREEYGVALAALSELMAQDPPRGSEAGDRLEVLAVLIEDYEASQWPKNVPSPVEAIRFRMEQQGLKQRDLVKYLGSASRVSEILSGKRGLTLPMVRALSQGLGIPAHVLVSEDSQPIAGDTVDWSAFPVREMVRRGWISSGATLTQKGTASALKAFFAAPETFRGVEALYRRSSKLRSNRTVDEPALLAWTCRVLVLAQNVDLKGAYEPGAVTLEFMRELVKISWAENAPSLARDFLARHGIALVIEPHLPRTHLDGAAILSDERRPIVGLTLRHDRVDNFWFVLMHELAHISLHASGEADVFYDDMDSETEEELESAADALAREVLVPSSQWEESAASRLRTLGAAEALARKLGVHTAIVAGRIRHAFNSYRILTGAVGHGEVRRNFPEVAWPENRRDT